MNQKEKILFSVCVTLVFLQIIIGIRSADGVSLPSQIACLALAILPGMIVSKASKRASRVGGKTYTYSDGSDDRHFRIAVKREGTFTFHVDDIQNAYGSGTWSMEGGHLTLTENSGLRYCFDVRENGIVFRSEHSDAFPYVTLSEGALFIASPESFFQ